MFSEQYAMIIYRNYFEEKTQEITATVLDGREIRSKELLRLRVSPSLMLIDEFFWLLDFSNYLDVYVQNSTPVDSSIERLFDYIFGMVHSMLVIDSIFELNCDK